MIAPMADETTRTPSAHPVPPEVISGPRLDLALVTVEQLHARDVLHPDDSPLAYRVAQVREDPSVNPWLLRLAVLRDTGEIVGLVNFHAPPDERGMVEIGYRVQPEYRRRGYAREIATTMWSYAASHPGVQWLRATVSPDNAASIAIIEGAGLVHVGEQDDPEDGLELVYEIAAEHYAG
jgi:RimJ/RimL family protein N-acetyltransferase